MKELRPGSTGRTDVRVLFAFDRHRKAILPTLIAADRFEGHQARIEKAAAKEKRAKRGDGRRRRRSRR
jgi:hypothetical protein